MIVLSDDSEQTSRRGENNFLQRWLQATSDITDVQRSSLLRKVLNKGTITMGQENLLKLICESEDQNTTSSLGVPKILSIKNIEAN